MRASLRDFVATQLNIRQEVLKLGDKNESRYSSVPLKIRQTDGKIKKVTLPAGSFYTQAMSKQCTIRMYSGVDIKPGTFPDYPNEPTGVKLAKRFFLEGGSGYNPEGGINLKSGFSRSTKNTGGFGALTKGDAGFRRGGGVIGAYGAERFRANPHKGYGILPMPGITNASIRTVSDYGSLRVAKVNFICYSLPQLEVLELLYMRPGFPILVEWGWAPYINNEGKIIESLPYYEDFWKSSSNLWSMHKDLIKRKKIYSGNYDNVLGFCKNFDYKSRPDGGFECTTEVMGYGEIMEGIQGRNDVSPNFKYQSNKNPNDDINQRLSETTKETYGAPPIPDWVVGLGDVASVEDNFVWLLSSLAFYTPLSSGISYMKGGARALYDEMMWGDQYRQGLGLDEQSDPNNPKVANRFQEGLHKVITYFQTIQTVPRDNGDNTTTISYESIADDIYQDYVVSSGFKGVGDNHVATFENQNIAITNKIEDQIFFRWDFLCELINKFVLPQYKEDKHDKSLTRYTYTHPDTNTYISYVGPPYFDVNIKNSIYKEASGRAFSSPIANYFPLGGNNASSIFREASLNTEMLVQSTDPNICIMPSQRKYESRLSTGGFVPEKDQTQADVAYSPEYVSIFYPSASESPDSSLDGKEHKTTGGASTTNYAHVNYGGKPMRGPRGLYYEGKEVELGDGSTAVTDAEGATDRYIGLIYINYAFLMKKYKEAKGKKDFSMFKYLQDIWKTIGEKACAGNHNFILHTEEDNATIRVIDLNVDPTKAPPNNVFEFKVQDKESVVREFEFSSTIPSSISSTIAIAAQSPNAFDKDSTTLSTFNKHVQSRFSEPIYQRSKESGEVSRLTSYRNLIKSFINNYEILDEYYNGTSYLGYKDMAVNRGRMNMSTKEINNIQKITQSQTSLIHQLNSIAPTHVNINEESEIDDEGFYLEPKYEEYYPEISYAAAEAQNTTPIPIEITLAIDGISGIRIGDVIKIHNDALFPRLPKGYLRDDIHWVIFGDDHSVTSGQDWVQKLTCQLTLMGSNSFKPLIPVKGVGDKKRRRLVENNLITRDWLDQEIVDGPQDNWFGLNDRNNYSNFLNPIANVNISYASSEKNFGPRTLNDGFHNGVDIPPGKDKNGKSNDNIYAPIALKVIGITSVNSSCGNGIKFQVLNQSKPSYINEMTVSTFGGGIPGRSYRKNPDRDDVPAGNDGAYGIFCHLKEFNVKKDGTALKVGDKLIQGERIGVMGNTGKGSLGKHLHYGLSATENFTNEKYTTRRYPVYEDGEIGSDFIETTYEKEFGIDPSYFVSPKDNLTEFFENVVESLRPAYVKTLEDLRIAYGRYIQKGMEGIQHMCYYNHQKQRNVVIGSPDIQDNADCLLTYAMVAQQAFGNMIEGKYPGTNRKTKPDPSQDLDTIGNFTMSITPFYGGKDYNQFFEDLNADPIARAMLMCANGGKITLESCPPESVGLDISLEDVSTYEFILQKGIMKP